MAYGLWDVVLQGSKGTKEPEQGITSPEKAVKDIKASSLIIGFCAQGTL